ncbi:hypothetical protein [Methanoregula sp.]|uniref:hypothetical protein n=1 Tax=Methanoregula sp. TaxID=2052170 RepID=UPI0035643F88
MSECKDLLYPQPEITESDESRLPSKIVAADQNFTEKTIGSSDLIEKTEMSNTSKTGYKQISAPYGKSKPKRTTIKAKII